jgi:hypothetical protein
MTHALVLALVLAMAPAAQAQTWPGPSARPGATVDRHRWEAERHRYEMDRLRLQADQRQAFARQVETEALLGRMEVEARRQPGPYVNVEPRALRSPEEERAAREAASERRRRSAGQVGEIDSWLDRAPQ